MADIGKFIPGTMYPILETGYTSEITTVYASITFAVPVDIDMQGTDARGPTVASAYDSGGCSGRHHIMLLFASDPTRIIGVVCLIQ
jgi:hypothetical protein